jgi:formylglycine-generating enzyme required for sulfatase activity
MSTTPLSVTIRRFLMESFSDEDVDTFSFDYFRAVHDDFTDTMSKGRKIQLLLEYGQNHGVFANILVALQKERPDQFAVWFPNFQPGAGSMPDIEFCLVPAGPFWMGSTVTGDEQPLQLNSGPVEDFWITRAPITVAQFQVFVLARRYPFKEQDALLDTHNHPMVRMTWFDALAFCDWLTTTWRASGILTPDWAVRLPTEAEWEKAARGGTQIPSQMVIRRAADLQLGSKVSQPALQANPLPQRNFPWGDQPDPSMANYVETGIGSPSAVGQFAAGASPYGCVDMAGNIWEWTHSAYRPYPYVATDGRENTQSAVKRTTRGGAYYNYAQYIRCPARDSAMPANAYFFVGFRAAITHIVV